MKFLDSFIELLKLFGPTIGAIIIAIYRDNAVEARNKERIAELETKLLQNRIDVEADNKGLNSDAVIDKYAPSSGDRKP